MDSSKKTNPAGTSTNFFKDCAKRKFEKGELVIRAGEPPDGIYYIASGLMKVNSINDSGEEYVHVIYRPGESFPLLWALKKMRRNVFYEAITPVELCFMPMDKFIKNYRSSPEFCKYILNQTAEQFSVYVDRIENLEYRRANERLAYRLLFLASRLATKRKNTLVLPAALTQQLIADSINLTRETVSREIEKLEAKGILSYTRHRLVINDVEDLKRQISEPVSSDYWGL